MVTINSHLKSTLCTLCNLDPELVLLTTKDLLVICDPFPLVEGHLMIVTKSHYACAGELPLQVLERLELLKKKLSRLMLDHFGRITLYEHGRAGSCTLVESEELICHHFHLHMLPFNSKSLDVSASLKVPQISIKSLVEVKVLFDKFGNYLFHQKNFHEGTFYRVGNNTIQPHLMRTLIANALEQPGRADWQKFDSAIQFRNSKSQLKSMLNQNDFFFKTTAF